MIHPSAREAGYRLIADDLRKRIAAGEFDPSGRLPSEADLRHAYGVSEKTLRAALALLVAQGLIVKRHGAPTRVRQTRPMSVVDAADKDHVVGARPCTKAEALEYDLPEGYPMLVLIDRRYESEIDAWPADRTRVGWRTED